MNIYKIHQSYNNNYTNHQMLKELFEGDGKILWQKVGDSITALTDINVSEKFKDEIGIENIGNVGNYLTHILNSTVDFSIRINNCKNKNGKHIAVTDDLDAWVDNKLSNTGCDVINKHITNEGIVTSLKNDQRIYHASLLVYGKMLVKDTAALLNTIENGIGRGKAFGFGMLNIFNF